MARNLFFLLGANESTREGEYEQYDQELIDICSGVDKEGCWNKWERAPESERIERVKILLKKGANPNIAGSHCNRSPLILAMIVGHHNLAATFLYAGSNPNVSESKRGYTPLGLIGLSMDRSNENNRTGEEIDFILKELLLAGASLNFTSPEGRTALMLAAKISTLEVVQRLLHIGANPHATTIEGTTAVDFALWAGKQETADFLRSLINK